MTEREACLVDVYDTLLNCDFQGTGPSCRRWPGSRPRPGPGIPHDRGGDRGRPLSTAEGYEQVLRASGTEPRPDLVRALVDLDRELLLRSRGCTTTPSRSCEELRSRGIKIAIVSNCTQHTRDLLESNGVAELADVLALSCEVGAFKPAAEIYSYALDQLGVPAGGAVFVDDQPSYCAGAADLGITAVQIIRGEPDGKVPAPGTTVVRSLLEVQALF